jgi:hypothetical protein
MNTEELLKRAAALEKARDNTQNLDFKKLWNDQLLALLKAHA